MSVYDNSSHSSSQLAAPGSRPENDFSDDYASLALASHCPPTIPPSNDSSNITDLWDGTKESLGSWFTELEMVLSLLNPLLSQLAIEGYVTEKGKCTIFHTR